MTDTEQVTRDLSRLADQGKPRGAAVVLGGARFEIDRSATTRTWMIRAGAAACLVLVAVAAWAAWPNNGARHQTKVGGGSPRVSSNGRGELAPIRVEGLNPTVLGVGFDRVWVGTGDSTGARRDPWLLQSFDRMSGARLTSTALPGKPYGFGTTNTAIFVRVTDVKGAECPPNADCDPPPDNLVVKIAPSDGRSEGVVATGIGDGPLAATHDRIAIADSRGVRIFNGDGRPLGRASMDEIIGQAPGTPPGTNGFTSLAFSGNGKLVGVHQGRAMVVGMDATTAKPIAGEVASLQPGGAVIAAVGSDRLWVTYETTAGRVVDTIKLDRPLIGLLRSFRAQSAAGVVGLQPGGPDRVGVLLGGGRLVIYHADGTSDGVVAGGCGSRDDLVVGGGDQAWVVHRCAAGAGRPTFRFAPLG